MKIADLCSPKVRVALAEQPLAEAARVMCEQHVGALVVVPPGDAPHRPIGIVTDRDIVRGQFTRGADLFCLSVGDVMTPRPHVLRADLELAAGLEALRAFGVRRAPVVDASGALCGLISLDDLLPALAEELGGLAQLMATQARGEKPISTAR